MNITLKEITVQELVNGYKDNNDEGGKTQAENHQMLCKHDNRIKSGK
jgi:hypothetical protein